MPSTGSENVGVAFGAVIAAGASTAVGAAIVFFPRLVKLASRRVLASSLGISAGVMTYVSFVEIFQKAQSSFAEHLARDYDDEEKVFGMANLYATLSFFLGVLTMVVIDWIVNLISSKHGDGDGHGHHDISESLNKDNGNEIQSPNGEEEKEEVEEVVIAPCATCRPDPAGDLKEWQEKAEAEEVRNMKLEGGSTLAGNGGSLVGSSDNDSENVPPPMGDDEERVELSGVPKVASMTEEEIENKKLVRMGIQTAVAIALHNFPEGLATFVAVLEDPKIGAILACAIGIHNIPEGFCVALPIYYATGNRKKAFWWGALSGMSEPVGALLGWLVLANSFSDAIYGLMFGLVAGMMVMISLKELLPTAYRYDPGDTVVTNSLIAGMVVISLSLVLYYV
jgi:ZIP family zinc transporter